MLDIEQKIRALEEAALLGEQLEVALDYTGNLQEKDQIPDFAATFQLVKDALNPLKESVLSTHRFPHK